MADPRVGRLLPVRLIETPSSQLTKHSPEDDLVTSITNFTNTLADEIRVQFQLDERLFQRQVQRSAKPIKPIPRRTSSQPDLALEGVVANTGDDDDDPIPYHQRHGTAAATKGPPHPIDDLTDSEDGSESG